MILYNIELYIITKIQFFYYIKIENNILNKVNIYKYIIKLFKETIYKKILTMYSDIDIDINENDWELLDKLITNSKLDNIKEDVIEEKMNFNKVLKNRKKSNTMFNNKCINCNSLNLVINDKNGYSVC
jgi:transcription initiation factor TFIIIB Brf1 subunit/transcription initiation factor TFIIB